MSLLNLYFWQRSAMGRDCKILITLISARPNLSGPLTVTVLLLFPCNSFTLLHMSIYTNHLDIENKDEEKSTQQPVEESLMIEFSGSSIGVTLY